MAPTRWVAQLLEALGPAHHPLWETVQLNAPADAATGINGIPGRLHEISGLAFLIVGTGEVLARFLADDLDRGAQGFLRQVIQCAREQVGRMIGRFWQRMAVELQRRRLLRRRWRAAVAGARTSAP